VKTLSLNRHFLDLVLNGGHDVPEIDIQRRFQRSQNNFWCNYKNLAHYWYLFYNANDGFIEVATGEGTQFTVTDEALFKLFLHQVTQYEQ